MCFKRGFPFGDGIYTRDISVAVARSWQITDAAVSIGHAQVVNDTRRHNDPGTFGRIVDDLTSSEPASQGIEGLVEDLSGVM